MEHMGKGIMKSLWDESSDLEDEILSTHSALSDDYTSGNIQDLKERIENEISDIDKDEKL